MVMAERPPVGMESPAVPAKAAPLPGVAPQANPALRADRVRPEYRKAPARAGASSSSIGFDPSRDDGRSSPPRQAGAEVTARSIRSDVAAYQPKVTPARPAVPPALKLLATPTFSATLGVTR